MPNTAKFWIVWEPDNPRPPTKRHDTLDDATKEAERLARRHRGKTFVVLEALATRTVDDMKRVELEAELIPKKGDPVEFGTFQFDAETINRVLNGRFGSRSVPPRPSPSCPLCDPDYASDDLPF